MIMALGVPEANAFQQNTGDISNTVCFVRFADEDVDAFDRQPEFYTSLFNAQQEGTTTVNSVYNYFLTASYGQLRWTSQFLPALSGSAITSLQVSHNRSYYQPYDASAYPDGYADATAMAAREQALVKEIASLLTKQVEDAGMDIDRNDDGMVDNLTIILSGNSMLSGRYMLWPHRSDLALPDEKAIFINGKKLTGYIIVFDGANGFSNFNPINLNTGVLCHEMSHSLGTYDLYHASGSLNPVGVWDLMSDNQHAAQEMSAYTKWRYCHWATEPEKLTADGTYTLRPLSSDPVNPSVEDKPYAYIISPQLPSTAYKPQYFVAEYRRKVGFDSNLPGEGLLVYRINSDYSMGNVNYNGTTRLDEMYILRPGGSATADGNISNAVMAKGNTYDALNGDGTMGSPFYQDGTAAAFSITEVTEPGATISFKLTMKEPEKKPEEDPEQEKAPEGAILWQTFENDGSLPEGWNIQTTGYRAWHNEASSKSYPAYNGNYSATVYSAWEDIHQDEHLMTPEFSHGTQLEFWSRSNSCSRTPRDPQYFLVEITTDGGATWHTMMNLPTDQDGSLSGKWNKVILDLSAYDSDRQQVRFRCYDTSGDGLSYYWQLDNIAVIGTSSAIGMVEGDTITDTNMFNLSGQRVSNAYRGIKIQNGIKRF